jgi:hypothetical protein
MGIYGALLASSFYLFPAFTKNVAKGRVMPSIVRTALMLREEKLKLKEIAFTVARSEEQNLSASLTTFV